MDPLQGGRFGRYQVLERLALGASAEVSRAALLLPDGVSQLVVLKRILPQHARDAQVQKLFREEAELLASLSHPNVVGLVDSGELGGSLFLALEHIDGGDLQVLLERAREQAVRLPVELAAHITVELCAALEYIHTRVGRGGVPLNIVHRDVSPHNLLCSRSGEVKLADFGIARLATREHTSDGSIKGKLMYMAPEQATPGATIDLRADLFAAGAVLYELLFDRPIFEGEDDARRLERFRRCDVWFDPRTLAAKHQPLLRIVRRCLRPRPKDRYPSARALGEELVAFLRAIGARSDEEQRRELASWVSARLAATAAPRTEERLAQELLGLHQEGTVIIAGHGARAAPATRTSPVQRPADETHTTEQRTMVRGRAPAEPGIGAELPAGTVLGGTYRLLRAIAGGGMGVVFEAQHTRITNLRCAVKVLRWSEVTGDRYARFRREAEIVAELKHPSVVRIIDFNRTDEGLPYLVMDLLEGEDLEAHLRRSLRLPVPDLVKMLGEIGGALAVAHARGVVHRDLKPSNIFLAQDGSGLTYKLLDFGISVQEDVNTPRITSVRTVLGTSPYMSPEQARGDLLVDNRSDIFSLATIVYRCLSGHFPFGGETPMEVREAVCSNPARPLSGFLPEAPPGLVETLARAHAKRREDRSSDVAAFVGDVIRTMAPLRSPAALPSTVLAPAEPAAELDDRTLPPIAVAGGTTALVSRRRGRLALVVMAVLVFGLAALVGWGLSRVPRSTAPTQPIAAGSGQPPRTEPLPDTAAVTPASAPASPVAAVDAGAAPGETASADARVRPLSPRDPTTKWKASADRKVRREKKEKTDKTDRKEKGVKKRFLRYDEI